MTNLVFPYFISPPTPLPLLPSLPTCMACGGITCANNNPTPNMDTAGAGAASGAVTGVASWEACRGLCCADKTCGTYTYVNGSKAPNHKTCYMRDLSSRVVQSPDCAAGSEYDCYSGERPGRPPPPPPPPPAPPPPPPLPPVIDPPSGMRSAVPLGGISCGAVELRGDGSLHEWTIMNQSPGGSGQCLTTLSRHHPSYRESARGGL